MELVVAWKVGESVDSDGSESFRNKSLLFLRSFPFLFWGNYFTFVTSSKNGLICTVRMPDFSLLHVELKFIGHSGSAIISSAHILPCK